MRSCRCCCGIEAGDAVAAMPLLFGTSAALVAAGVVARRRFAAAGAAATQALVRSQPTGLSGGDEGLPPPVARYLALVAPGPAPPVVTLVQHGELRLSAAGRWLPFTATQCCGVGRAGFVWDARVRAAPGLAVHVRDACVAGVARADVRLAGVLPLAGAHGDPRLLEGALQRWLAEVAWYPWALRGLHWTPVDARCAVVRLHEGAVTAALELRFGADGLLDSAYTVARWRAVGGDFVATPWECRYAGYAQQRDAVLPERGEAGWYEGAQYVPVWRGCIARA